MNSFFQVVGGQGERDHEIVRMREKEIVRELGERESLGAKDKREN